MHCGLIQALSHLLDVQYGGHVVITRSAYSDMSATLPWRNPQSVASLLEVGLRPILGLCFEIPFSFLRLDLFVRNTFTQHLLLTIPDHTVNARMIGTHNTCMQ